MHRKFTQYIVLGLGKMGLRPRKVPHLRRKRHLSQRQRPEYHP